MLNEIDYMNEGYTLYDDGELFKIERVFINTS